MAEKPTYEELEKRIQELEIIESEYKSSKEALRNSEAQYRLLFEHANIGIFVAQDGYLKVPNPYLSKLLGYSLAELDEQPFTLFIHPDYHSLVNTRHQERLSGKTDLPQTYDFRVISKNGTIIWVQLSTFLIQFKGRLATLNFLHDITDRKRAEEDSTRSENRYKLLSDATFEAIFISENGICISQNNTASKMFGYTESEASGRMATEWIHPDDREQVQKNILSGFEGPYEVKALRRDGSAFHCSIQGRNYAHKGRNLRITALRDISDRKQAEMEKEKLQKQLNQAQKMESIGSLAGGIAHDFNNLLFPIVGLSEMMLADFPPDSPEHHNLHEIFLAGKRGRELVQQILSFSRQSEQQLIPVHIQKVLKEVLKLCRATIPTDIPITRDIQSDCGPVMADPTQIHQIAMNLITNAYHAVEPVGGSILIQLTETDVDQEDDPIGNLTPGRYAMLTISDTGMGIDPAVIDKIFDPYFTTKEKGRGTGLGLATVYGIVKAYGGEIKVSSDIDKGASFQIYLPVLEKTADDIPEKQQQTLPAGTEHILLVDDEQSIVHLEKQILERLGYTVTCFNGSMEALATFRSDPASFDLIITDMNMPHLNGMQLAKELIAVMPDIPIIICTGFSERINSRKAQDSGIKGLLNKPLGMEDLACKVREVLDE